jgi:hypothetical protein
MAKTSFADRVGALGIFGTTVQCDSESTSMYCRTVKAFNLLMMVLFVAFILWLLLKK